MLVWSARIIILALTIAGSFGSSGVPAAAADRWEKDIAAFEANDQKHPPAPGGVLFVGSSSIRMWTNLTETFPEWKIVQRGFGGSHLSDVNAYFDRLVLAYKPSTIVLYAGENDISAGRSPEDVFQEFKTFVGKVRAHLPGTPIYFLSMKLSLSRWYLSPQIVEGNRLIQRSARFQPKVTFVDVATPLLDANGRPDPANFLKDELHLNGRGYELWAREIRQTVKD